MKNYTKAKLIKDLTTLQACRPAIEDLLKIPGDLSATVQVVRERLENHSAAKADYLLRLEIRTEMYKLLNNFVGQKLQSVAREQLYKALGFEQLNDRLDELSGSHADLGWLIRQVTGTLRREKRLIALVAGINYRVLPNKTQRAAALRVSKMLQYYKLRKYYLP